MEKYQNAGESLEYFDNCSSSKNQNIFNCDGSSLSENSFCNNDSISECNDGHKRQLDTFQTPLSISDFSEKLPSSTPITISHLIRTCNKSGYKTPGRKRKLFHSNTNLGSSPGSSAVKFVPVSSPATSELVKLSDSRFLNSDFSITFDVNTSTTVGTNKEMNTESSLLLTSIRNNSNFTDVLNDCIKTENNEKNHFDRENNSYINLAFRSFDLLPGITPLNDSDV